MTKCGISNVHFDGTREDWVQLGNKLAHLEKYDVNGELKKYVDQVKIILEQFLSTYDGKVDVDWWNRIITTEEER